MLKFISRFLASRVLSILLIAALSGGAVLIYNKIKYIGQLEISNQSLSEANERYKANERLYSKLDKELALQRQENSKQLYSIQREINKLKDSNDEIKDFLNRPAPASLSQRLCEQGYYGPELCAQNP